ncbi:MAG: hypothetical protein GF393_01225 [Armatimonadia bacterium]|nr:hypothetical protein [Armatimonadia bacterium]
MSEEQAQDRHTASTDHTAAKVLALVAGLFALLVLNFIVGGSVLIESLDAHVHAGMTRAEIEAYLGEATGTMASTDEIPEEDRERYDLPDVPAPGGIVSYKPRYEPEWLAETPVGLHMRMWNWVFVYYDEDDVAIEVHVRNFS